MYAYLVHLLPSPVYSALPRSPIRSITSVHIQAKLFARAAADGDPINPERWRKLAEVEAAARCPVAAARAHMIADVLDATLNGGKRTRGDIRHDFFGTVLNVRLRCGWMGGRLQLLHVS